MPPQDRSTLSSGAQANSSYPPGSSSEFTGLLFQCLAKKSDFDRGAAAGSIFERESSAQKSAIEHSKLLHRVALHPHCPEATRAEFLSATQRSREEVTAYVATLAQQIANNQKDLRDLPTESEMKDSRYVSTDEKDRYFAAVQNTKADTRHRRELRASLITALSEHDW